MAGWREREMAGWGERGKWLIREREGLAGWGEREWLVGERGNGWLGKQTGEWEKWCLFQILTKRRVEYEQSRTHEGAYHSEDGADLQ
jgi:hypothetical protein